MQHTYKVQTNKEIMNYEWQFGENFSHSSATSYRRQTVAVVSDCSQPAVNIRRGSAYQKIMTRLYFGVVGLFEPLTEYVTVFTDTPGASQCNQATS